MNGAKGRKMVPATVWLMIGCVFVLFMGGKWNLPIAVWIGSIFLLRYFRTARGFPGIALALPFILLTSHLFFLGLAVQVTPVFQLLIAVSYTLYLMAPCLIDRLLYRKVDNSLLSSLVYPAALVVVQFLLSYIEELGTVLNWTGALFEMKPLIQLVSITGVWGPSFLVGWLASVFNALWEERFDLRRVMPPAHAPDDPGGLDHERRLPRPRPGAEGPAAGGGGTKSSPGGCMGSSSSTCSRAEREPRPT